MVLSSMSPLFLLWAVRGSSLVPDRYLVLGCAIAILAPAAVLGMRIRTAKRTLDNYTMTVTSSEDHRDHLLVYLFAMLLPFYSIDTSSWRDVAALLCAVAFVALVFWHLNLHYMNVIFAVAGYRIFTIYVSAGHAGVDDREPRVLITKRDFVTPGEITALRISDTVFLKGG
jgi:hypothetical protein